MYYYDTYGWATTEENPERSTDVAPPAESGGQRPNWTGTGWVLATYTAPVAPPALPPSGLLTKRAFQNRFPKSSDGISTKYDALCLFLSDDGYAASLGVSGAALYSLRKLIITGINRLEASPFVNYGVPDAANFTGLLLQASIPAEFRLTVAERTAMLTTPINADEAYKE